MSASSRLSIRTEVLKWCFSLYACTTLISMAVMSIGAALLMVAVLFSSGSSKQLLNEFREEWKRPTSRVYFWVSLGLTIACTVSLISGKFFPVSYGGLGVKIQFWKDIAKVWYLFWPWLLVIGLRRLTETERWFVIKTWLGTFGVLSALGIVQFFTGWPREQRIPGEIIHFHATLFLGHHLSVASIFIFPFFATLDYAYSSVAKRSYWFFAAAALGLTTLFFTYSRTLWLALPIGILIWTVTRIQKRSSRAILLFFVGLCCLAASQYGPIRHRLQDRLGIGSRQDLWLANIEFLKERPLFGVGWRHNQELSGYYLMDKYHIQHVFSGHAHNNLIDMLGGTGSIGTLAWLAWCICIFWILIRKKYEIQNSNFTHGLLCAWIVFHLNGLTQVNFWEAKVQHQMAWVIAWSLL